MFEKPSGLMPTPEHQKDRTLTLPEVELQISQEFSEFLKTVDFDTIDEVINKKAQMFKGGQIFWGVVIFTIGAFYFWISFK